MIPEDQFVQFKNISIQQFLAGMIMKDNPDVQVEIDQEQMFSGLETEQDEGELSDQMMS